MIRKRLILALVLSILLGGCSEQKVYVQPQVVSNYKKQNPRKHKFEEKKYTPNVEIIPKNITDTVSANWSCSIDAIYRYDDRDWYYEFSSEFSTDGNTTELKDTNKFLGNYGIQPINVTPIISNNAIQVDLNEYLNTEDITIERSSDEFEWYFFTPSELVGKPLVSTLTLSDINFNAKATISDNSLTRVELSSLSSSENLKKIHIILELQKEVV